MRPFDVIPHIKTADTKFFDETTINGFSPYLFMLWFRSAVENREYHVVMTNEFVNKYAFSLQQHPILLYKALCVANEDHGYIKFEFIKKPKPVDDEAVNTIMEYHNYTYTEAVDALDIYDLDDVREMAMLLGKSDEYIKGLE